MLYGVLGNHQVDIFNSKEFQGTELARPVTSAWRISFPQFINQPAFTLPLDRLVCGKVRRPRNSVALPYIMTSKSSQSDQTVWLWDSTQSPDERLKVRHSCSCWLINLVLFQGWCLLHLCAGVLDAHTIRQEILFLGIWKYERKESNRWCEEVLNWKQDTKISLPEATLCEIEPKPELALSNSI